MDASSVTGVMSDGLYTILIVSAPLLLVSLIVGIVISIIQAATQIHEQTLTFVPKLVAIFVVLLMFGGWMMTQLTEFTTRLFESVLLVVR